MIVLLRTYLIIWLLAFLVGTYAPFLQSESSQTNHSNYTTLRPSWWDKLKCNFHVVQAGALYRCKQLSSRKLTSFVKKFGIRTIVNLRGKHPEQRWWIDEKKVAQLHKLHFYNIPMRAEKPPDKKDLIKLFSIYKKAPRPILVHCHHGADRTGEAAALWKLEQEKTTKKIALQQLSWRYWHISSRFPLKRRLINHWQGMQWLKQKYKPETIAMCKPNVIN